MKEKDIQMIKEQWFPEHIAISEKLESKYYPLERISWRNKNGSSNFYVEYIKSNAGLYISGDIGSTVIQQDYDFEWLSNANSGYLREKIDATSEMVGPYKGVSWCGADAAKYIKNLFKDWTTEFLEDPPVKEQRRHRLEQADYLKSGLLSHSSSYNDLQGYIYESTDQMDKIFGYDWLECELHSSGIILSTRLFAQQVGIQMALKQLEKN